MGIGIFDSRLGGDPVLFQHFFWFYSHPAVYIMILPAMGFVSDILCTFARKPLFGYRPMIYSMSAIAGLGFVVWGHHMFQSGMNPYLGTAFMVLMLNIGEVPETLMLIVTSAFSPVEASGAFPAPRCFSRSSPPSSSCPAI